MELKNDEHIFTGMERDVDISKHKPEHLYDAYNIRINPREEDTLLGITNERGPLYKDSYSGKYVGHIVIDNEYIILFLTQANVIKHTELSDPEDLTSETITTYISTNAAPVSGETQLSNKDVIIKIDISDYSYKFLFIGKLNLNKDYPISGHYRYESSHIRKVYWVDGLNQPRMINIEKEESSIEDGDTISTRFDFIQTLKLNEEVEVTKCIGGTFAPGVIQYAFSYFYLNGQETNIFMVTPLNYIGSENTKTVSPEGKSNDAFKIELSNLETKFDYLRIYSIHRTSWNATPECKVVTDIKITDDELTYIDYGNSGSTISPTEMFYIGGQVITPSTMAFKDSVLFLANYKMDMPLLRNATLTKEFSYENVGYGTPSNPWTWDGSLHYDDSGEAIIPKFKNGEHYLFGIQIQDKYGRWSDPLLLDEKTIPGSSYNHISKVNCTVSGLPSNAVKARGVCIYPTTEQRKILATGVISPTLYQQNSLDTSHRVYQSSWFFRPEHSYSVNGYQFEHNTSIFQLGADNDDSKKHLNTAAPTSLVEIDGGGYNDVNTNFMVSYDVIDFYSPDAEFDYLADSTNSLFKLLYIGDIGVDSAPPYDMVEIQQLRLDAASEYNNAIGPIFKGTGINEHTFMHTYKDGSTMKNKYYYVYPWNSAGSFTTPKTSESYTNSFNTPFDSLSSNKLLHWINGFTLFADAPIELTGCKYKSYLEENGDSSLEFNGNYYLGQVETVLQTASVPRWAKPTENGEWFSDFTEKRVVEMKYKTCSHLTLSLNKPLYFNVFHPSSNTDGRNTITVTGFYNNSAVSTVGRLGSSIADMMKEVYGVFDASGINVENVYTDDDQTQSLYDALPIYVIGRMGGTGEFYLFRVTLQWYNSNGNKLLSNIYCTQVSGTDLANKYVWSGDVNVVTHYYDSGGVIHGYPSIGTDWASLYSGQYILENGKLTKYIETNNTPVNTNEQGVPIPSQETPFAFNGRLVLADLLNENPVPLQDDVPWVPASTTPSDVVSGTTTITFDIGDTWIQDYYCIKTFPFTREDDNSITEILKFQCPTRTNLAGRYSTIVAPPAIPEVNREKFSLINQVYSNQNNFFAYSKVKETETVLDETVNSMTWCQENIPNSDIDSNTSISLLNNYIFGERITALVTNNLSFYAFHPSSISKISFNPRVEISPSDGIPVELGTSKRMYGSDTLVSEIGTTNKNAIIVTDIGIFFVDDNKRVLYLLGDDEKVTNISGSKNFNSWFNTQSWLSEGKLFYDKINNDLYLIGQNDCLVFNVGLQEFTSFMSYEGVPSMFNVGYNFYAFDWYYNRTGLDDNYTSLYHMFNGNYNEFFGVYKPVYLSFISNPDSQYDKIFSTLESRMDVYNGDTLQTNRHFDYIRVWNEYQDSLEVPVATAPYNRRYENTTGKKKFRVWRIDFPRDNNNTNRIRNTWTNIKLGFNTPTQQAHGVVANITGATNPNIAKYYNDIEGHAIQSTNIQTPLRGASTRATNSTSPTYDKLRMLLHDINVKYFI